MIIISVMLSFGITNIYSRKAALAERILYCVGMPQNHVVCDKMVWFTFHWASLCMPVP